MGSEGKPFSHSEVSVHKTSDDCWVIINAKVYSITNFLNEHPGGDEVLLAAAGKDASEEFEDVGHGSAARLMLDEFYVGEIDPSIKPATFKAMDATLNPTYKNVIKDKSSSKLTNNKLFYFLVAFAITIMALGFNVFNN